MHLRHRLFDSAGDVLDNGVGREIVGDGDRGELALVVDHQRRDRTLDLRHLRQRHLGVASAHDVDVGEVARVALVFAVDFQDHAVLVALGVDGGNLPLRERVVERVVDVLDAHAEAGGRRAVDADIGLQAALLAVGGDVDHAGHLLHAVEHLRHPGLQCVDIGAPQRELILRIALPAADPQVLRRHHEHADAGDLAELGAQPPDHALRAHIVALDRAASG